VPDTCLPLFLLITETRDFRPQSASRPQLAIFIPPPPPRGKRCLGSSKVRSDL